MSEQDISTASNLYPLLPLRDVVVFPHMVIPLFVGRSKSIKALETAMEAGKSIMLVAQKTAAKDEPTADDLYEVGCIANILQMLKLPDGTVKVLVEGTQRANIREVSEDESHFMCEAVPVPPGGACATRAMVAVFSSAVSLSWMLFTLMRCSGVVNAALNTNASPSATSRPLGSFNSTRVCTTHHTGTVRLRTPSTTTRTWH